MCGARSRYPPWYYFSTFRDEPAQLPRILIIDIVDFFFTEKTHLATPEWSAIATIPAATAPAATATTTARMPPAGTSRTALGRRPASVRTFLLLCSFSLFGIVCPAFFLLRHNNLRILDNNSILYIPVPGNIKSLRVDNPCSLFRKAGRFQFPTCLHRRR